MGQFATKSALLLATPWLTAGLLGCGGSASNGGNSGGTTPTLSVNSTTIAFGDVDLNTKATQSLTLTSTGTAPVTVNSVTISGTGYSFSGSNFPLTLSSTNPTTSLSVDFDPKSDGMSSGQLTVSSNSSVDSTAEITLTGTGVSGTTTYQVDLTWSAPQTSPDPVAKYDVYRSPSGESDYQFMGSVSLGALEYTDTNDIQNGQTYDYIVESVDSSGNESVPSNTASVMVPN